VFLGVLGGYLFIFCVFWECVLCLGCVRVCFLSLSSFLFRFCRDSFRSSSSKRLLGFLASLCDFGDFGGQNRVRRSTTQTGTLRGTASGVVLRKR